MDAGDGGLTENYAGAFDGHLPFGDRPALIVVDAVMAYFEQSSPLYAGVEAALASIERLVAAARMANIPVIFTRVVYEPGGADGGLFYRKIPVLNVFDAGSPLGEFPPSLQPASSDIIITKHYASSFFGTRLAAILTALKVDTLLITGFSTSGCVRATALDALQSGFAPFVVRDACGDRHPAPHVANLFDMQAKYAEVIGEDDALALLPSERHRH
jgi:maleamate amidohydrolase